MDGKTFEKVFKQQIDRCTKTLIDKAKEYATRDRLHNFKVSAALQDETPQEALGGMMSKHTVSIYDMIRSENDFPLAVWDEKITDHINYLILLRALVEEEASELPQGT